MIQSSLLLFIFLCLCNHVQSDSLPPVYKHGCVYLTGNQRIYCHGGANRSGTSMSANATYSDDSQLYDQHVYLDVSQQLNLSSANTQWQAVPPPSKDFKLEPRADFAMVSHNSTAYVVAGGQGSTTAHGDQSLSNITIRYEAVTNVWSVIKSQNPIAPKFNFTMDTQAFGGRGVKVSDKEYMITGGIPPNNNTILPSNTSYIDIEEASPQFGQLQVWIIPITRGGNMFPERSRIFRHDVATSRNGVVYFFGGMLPINATNNYDYRDNLGYYSFDNLLTFFPLRNHTFDVTKTNGNVPEGRQLHTVTAIPNTDTMLMYGGTAGSNGALPDYCYIFDTTTGAWKQAVFTNGDGAGRRYGHQAVMVGNDLLYIIGGVDISNMVKNDVNILNVTSMTWLNGSYTNTYDQSKAATSSAAEDSQSGTLSGGAIAGIVIGCVAGLAILVAAAVITRIQRKKKSLLSSGAAPAGFSNDAPPMASVNAYNIQAPQSPTSEGSTTVYSANPSEGKYDHIHSSTVKSAMY